MIQMQLKMTLGGGREERTYDVQNYRKERKKERKSLWPNTYIKYIQRFVGLSKYDYIRKMLNKNHLGKVPSKAAER